MFLIWGYSTAITIAAVWASVRFTGNPEWQWGWWLLFAVGGGLSIMFYRRRRNGLKSQLDRIVSNIWRIFMLVSAAVAATYCAGGIIVQWGVFNILFVIYLLVTVCVTITGAVINSRALMACGSAGILCSLALPFVGYDATMLLCIVIIAVSMIVPGHILNRQVKRRQDV